MTSILIVAKLKEFCFGGESCSKLLWSWTRFLISMGTSFFICKTEIEQYHLHLFEL
jgi:hypothetical protein